MNTGEVVSEHLGAHRFAFSLSGSFWGHLEETVWLFRVAELFGYDFQTILHFADEFYQYSKTKSFHLLYILVTWAFYTGTSLLTC
jgi:hypothetical protein